MIDGDLVTFDKSIKEFDPDIVYVIGPITLSEPD